jgi:phage gp45-like
MHDMTVRSGAWRAFMSGGSRGTVDNVRSYHMMQEMVGSFFKGESRNNVEHFEPYGITGSIVGKNADGVAEAAMSFMSGNKAHAIAGVIGDRRYRLRGLMSGETAQHDDIGQATILRRVGAFLVSLDGQGNASQDTPGASNNNRMASMRHVQKQKQPQPPATGFSDATQADQQQQAQTKQTAENFKHEGEQEKVNAEVRVDAKGIHYYTGTKQVGYYQNSKSGQTPKWNWDVDQQGKTVVEYQLK